jgi:hypothetical protein
MITVNASLGAFHRQGFIDASQAVKDGVFEHPWGKLSNQHLQLCPQNRGFMTEDVVDDLLQAFPETQFRLHANVRTTANLRRVADLSSWDSESSYFEKLAMLSKRLKAPAYTAHAGLRSEATLKDVLKATRRAEDVFGCPVGIEGHYPVKGNVFLISSWAEYQEMFESGAKYALDLSHLNIVAHKEGVNLALTTEMLASEQCIEVHLSFNDGRGDQHLQCQDESHQAAWWMSLLSYVNPEATVFSEGASRHH